MAYAYREGSLLAYPYCTIAIRVCAMPECHRAFVTQPKLRRKYCSDACSAQAIIERSNNKMTSMDQALRHLERDRRSKSQRRAFHDVHRLPAEEPLKPKVEPWKRPVENRHVPGSIAFMLLYSDSRPTFSLGNSGEGRVGRGGGRSAMQIGGVNL